MRSKHHLRFIFWIFKFVGIIRRKLYNNRLQKIVEILRPRYWKIVDWIRNRKKNYVAIVDAQVERALICNYMFDVMAKFKLKIMMIQRKVRAFLQIRNARFANLRVIWEKHINLYITKKGIKNRNKQSKYKINSGIRDEFLRKYYLDQLKMHTIKVVEHLKVCEKIKADFERASKQSEIFNLLNGIGENDRPEYPLFPVFKLYTNSSIIKNIVMQLIEQPTTNKISTQEIRDFLDRSKIAGTPIRFNEFYLTRDISPNKNKKNQFDINLT